MSETRIQTDKQISRMEGELCKEAIVAKNATVQIEAGRKVKRSIDFYNLRFQSGISSGNHGGRRYMPYVFTEQGVARLSAVLQFNVKPYFIKMCCAWS